VFLGVSNGLASEGTVDGGIYVITAPVESHTITAGFASTREAYFAKQVAHSRQRNKICQSDYCCATCSRCLPGLDSNLFRTILGRFQMFDGIRRCVLSANSCAFFRGYGTKLVSEAKQEQKFDV